MKDLLKRIKHHEGYRAKVYKCTEGYDTIGYGFAIKDLALEEDICEEILLRKLKSLNKSVVSKFPFFEDLPSECKSVLMEMCFQLGVTGVSRFKKALKAMEDGIWEKAADEMLDSKWAKQTPNRAKELSNIVRSLHEEKSSTKGNSNT